MDRQRVIEKLTDIEFKIGDQVYKIVRELGRGGNGVAFLCQNAKKQKVVAKVYLPPDTRDLDEKALERFENEVALTERLKHPNIVPSLGFGAVNVGAYRLPFYMMPQAAGTLRGEIRNDTDPIQIERKLRIFLRAAFGVVCLHAHGIVHRDLKPENILISREGVPWVADLGIAHVNPDFVTVGLQTIESERLLNRDYYAPEQRFGKATAVDRRADIYALGCIFYEMLTSIPPVRTNAPKLSVISSVYKPFEPIWERMTAWEADARYQTLEDALEDLSLSFGWVLASLKGAAGLQHPDLATMTKLLKASNGAHQQRGIDLAVRLGKSALTELHALAGHGKRDVRNACARALGLIGDDSSIPILVAGLSGNSDKPNRFRPSTDTAAESLAQFPPEKRLTALRLIKSPLRPMQVQTILSGMIGTEAYDAVVDLKKRGLLLVDWAETDFQPLVSIDEERVWPEILLLLDGRDDLRIQHILPALSIEKKVILLAGWIQRGATYSWYFQNQLKFLSETEVHPDSKLEMYETLQQKVEEYQGKFDEKQNLLTRIRAEIKKLIPV
jgi:serine/threonine protein kinase